MEKTIVIGVIGLILAGGMVWCYISAEKSFEEWDRIFKLAGNDPFFMLYMQAGRGIFTYVPDIKEGDKSMHKRPSKRKKTPDNNKPLFQDGNKSSEARYVSTCSLNCRLLIDKNNYPAYFLKALRSKHIKSLLSCHWQIQVELLPPQSSDSPAGYLEVYFGEKLKYREELILSSTWFLKKSVGFQPLSEKGRRFFASLHAADIRNHSCS
jgi:hypothetical protein